VCGRYTIAEVYELYQHRFNFGNTDVVFKPSYNVAPGQTIPVLASEERRTLKLMRWGLVPFWAKDERIGNRMINALAETVGERPSFRRSFSDRRCLVLGDGYYEWKKVPGQRGKTPMLFTLESGEPFAFAGLWDCWCGPEGRQIHTYTIITTEANDLSRPIHNRMPVILKQGDEDQWVDPENKDVEHLSGLLVPYKSKLMKAHEVSRLVNSPSNNSPDCIRPIDTDS
jgi:putative SOS response-associated peptidase YedK